MAWCFKWALFDNEIFKFIKVRVSFITSFLNQKSCFEETPSSIISTSNIRSSPVMGKHGPRIKYAPFFMGLNFAIETWVETIILGFIVIVNY